MTLASRMPVIHAEDLSPARRAAFGRWVRSVYGLVEHLDGCPFGCTAAETRCAEGDAAVDAEHAQWQAWREIAPCCSRS